MRADENVWGTQKLNSFAYLIAKVLSSFAHIFKFCAFYTPGPQTKGRAVTLPINPPLVSKLQCSL